MLYPIFETVWLPIEGGDRTMQLHYTCSDPGKSVWFHKKDISETSS